jgi:hypothetical protein
LLKVVGFAAMVFGELALALGALGSFARFQLGLVGLLLVLLGLRGVETGLLAVTTGLFAQPHPLDFAAPLGFLREDGDEREDCDCDHDDYGDNPNRHASSIPVG